MGITGEGLGEASKQIGCVEETLNTLAVADEDCAAVHGIDAGTQGSRSNVNGVDAGTQGSRSNVTKAAKEVPTIPVRIVEVFSVRFLETEQHDMQQMYGCILIAANPTYVIFSRKDGDPLYINSQGFVKLRGPNVTIWPCDQTTIVPLLFKYQACADQFECNRSELLFNTVLEDSYDMFKSRRVQSQFGQIEINYVVYLHALEARVYVTLMDCQFPSATIFGRISAQNAMIGEQGKSLLFDRDKSEGISIGVSPCNDRVAHVPLARYKIGHPVDSSLTIFASIWKSSSNDEPDQAIAENAEFGFATKLGGEEVRTFKSAACVVTVRVMWPKMLESIGQQGYYSIMHNCLHHTINRYRIG